MSGAGLRASSLVVLLALATACGGSKPTTTNLPSSEVERPRAEGPPTHGGGLGVGPAEPAPQRESVAVELDQKLVVNGNPVRLPWRLEEAKHVLGTPDRSLSLANVLHVYDGKGIVLYEPPSSAVVRTLSLYFARASFKFMPETLFTGTLTIQGVRIDGASTVGELRRRIRARWEVSGNDTAFARYGGWSVAIVTIPESGRVKYVQIEKL